jgi:hypothetical protein
MSRLARLRRILSRTLGILGVGALVALIGARLYLRSASAARLVEEKLQVALGVPVEIDSVSIPFRGDSSVTNLRLIDPDDGKPFLRANKAVADLSVLRYLRRGASPRYIDLLDVSVRLRFDAEGNLLTAVPKVQPGRGPLPALRLRGGRLTVEQQGRLPFTLEGVSLTLQPSEEKNLFGVIDDPVWGAFDVGGRVERTGDFSVALENKGLRLTHAMLEYLPFAPKGLWRQVEADGPDVGLKVTLAVASPGQPRSAAGGGRRGQRAPERTLGTPRVRYGVAFDRARITLPQPDRKPFTVSPARAVLKGDGNGFRLEGEINDSYWGNWGVRAALLARTGAVTLDLHTPEVLVDQKKLTALPYVPRSVWKQVEASGRTSARVEVKLWTHKPDVSYRVTLGAKDAKVFVPAIDLHAGNVCGGVVVEDSRVWLRDVTGGAAGGALTTSAEMDFRSEPLKMKFAVRARGLVLNQLPKKWGLPADKIDGKVTGQANLTVMVRDGVPETAGVGKGRIDDVKLAGIPSRYPIPLDLEADGKGPPRFKPRSQILHLLLYAVSPDSTTKPPALVSAQRKRPSPLEPARLVGEAVSGIGRVANQIAAGASEVLSYVARIDRPARPARKPFYLNATVRLDDVDLADLVKRLGVSVPVELAGRLSFRVTVGVPINSPRDFKTYRLDGSATFSKLSIAGLEMSRVQAHLHYENGRLRLDKVSGQLPGAAGNAASFVGSARVGVLPRGNLNLDLALRELPVERLLRPVTGPGGKVSGIVSGTIRAGAPVDRLQDPGAWTGAAGLLVPRLEAFGLTLTDFSTGATALGGLATLSDVKGELQGASLTGSATLSLTGAQRYAANLSLRGLDVGRLTVLLSSSWSGIPARGAVRTSAELSGSLRPLAVSGSGNLRSGPLRLAHVRIDTLSLDWSLRGGKLKVSDFLAELGKGKITGSAEAPVGDAPGEGRAALHLKELTAPDKGFPFRVEGRVSGKAAGAYRPGAEGKAGTWTGEVDLSAPTLKVQNIPAQKLHGRVVYRDGKAEYRLDGETLGGKLTIEGKLPPPPRSSTGRFDGRLRLEQVRLARLWPAFGLRDRLGPLRGTFRLDLPYRHEGPKLAPVGQGRFEVRDLRWRDSELAESVAGDVRLNREGVYLRDVSAVLGGGVARLSLGYRFRHAARSWFSLSLSAVEAGKLLVFDDTKDLVQGPLDLTLRGGLGQEWRGGGQAVLSHGKVLGVEVGDWRVPLEFTAVPSRSHFEVAVHDSHAQVGQGRAQLRASLTSSGGTRVKGTLRLLDAGLRSLSGLLGDVSSYASGRVTGRVDFAGSEVRSVNDLTAQAQANLREAQALQLPVLSLLVPFLMPGQASATFRTGDFRARLANGVWRISQLTLESTYARLIIQGSMTVRGGLDLDVVARTSSLGGVNPVLLQAFLRRLPPVGPVPVGLIFQVTQLLSNRVIHARLSGTTRTPRIQIEPIRLLTEEAVRFFLTGAP